MKISKSKQLKGFLIILFTILLMLFCTNNQSTIPNNATGGANIVAGTSGVAGVTVHGGSVGASGASGASGTTNGGSAGVTTNGGQNGSESGSSGSGNGGSSGSILSNTGGGTIDVGTGGSGNTIDVGTGGVGGTIDIGSGGTVDTGSGGTIDTGSGGTIDTSSGGTIDTGTGGTIDTCIPSCVPDILGIGEDAVNLVVFEDATASGCDTEGRMWVGGNANLSGYGVGAQLADCDINNPVLVVGGDLTITGGVKGQIWVGGIFTGTAPQCGGIWDNEPAPVDFVELRDTLTAYSNLIANYPVNGTVSLGGARLVLTGTDPDINIIEVNGDDLTYANGITINAPVSSSMIVNITGTSAGFNGGTITLPDGIECGSGAVELDDFCNQLIWNMPEVTTLEVGGISVQGSVLAPNATMVSSGSGNINGTVIVENFNISTCIEMHPHYFNGCLCTEEVNSLYACCP
jgi:choice-of-anchor A domain-containing protein